MSDTVNTDEDQYFESEMTSVDGERREEVRVIREDNVEREERVVEKVGAEGRALMSKLTSLVWLLAGTLEALIAMRFFLKLIAANANAPFVSLVYRVADPFLWPFAGITVTPSVNGMVLELSSLIVMFVYAILFRIVVRLLHIVVSPPARAGSLCVGKTSRSRLSMGPFSHYHCPIEGSPEIIIIKSIHLVASKDSSFLHPLVLFCSHFMSRLCGADGSSPLLESLAAGERSLISQRSRSRLLVRSNGGAQGMFPLP